MKKEELVTRIRSKESFLCIGLDPDLDKIPAWLLTEEDPIFSFNKTIIDATHKYCVAYKPNTAFYEAYGIKGWQSLQRTIEYLNENYPDHFTIADAKRGDIGNTSTRYAKAFFEEMQFDAITVAPYMGRDSVEPFLAFTDRFTILLALTSNDGAGDFQTGNDRGQELYKKVLATSLEYKNAGNLMYVVGATKAEYLKEIRQLVPDAFLLVPGLGAQGGDLQEVCRHGMNSDVGLLVNSSRGIIYAGAQKDFARAAAARAMEIQVQMSEILRKR
jgi:orotidine-5'-phosphate decarboxylase